MALLFCNVGWMEQYKGQLAGDQIHGGGSWVQEQGMGHEVCNFSPHKNWLYGYVQPPGEQIDLTRLGAVRDAEALDGVTVIWTARRPSGGTTVVGWYHNATVYREYQWFDTVPAVHHQNDLNGYWFKAPANEATLLSVDARTCEIPRGVKGGLGQSNLWYADQPESAEIVRRVVQFMSDKQSKRPIRHRPGGAVEHARKALIEQVAIGMCREHFEQLGYTVNSVEKDHVGWDLVARSGRTLLRIEVKGLSGEQIAVALTPNEYRAFSEQAEDYRLAVVSKALTNAPELTISRYSRERGGWVVEGRSGRSLLIQPRESAIIRCT